MSTDRLEAFSDGVIAIIITIMVLELKPPEDYNLESIYEVLPTFIIYFVSFIYVSIYWIEHHHLFKLTETVNDQVLWSNLMMLFWLSLIPFTTDWVGEDDFGVDRAPVLVYGFVLLMSKLSYLHLRARIMKHHGRESDLARIIQPNKKDAFVITLYLISFALTLLSPHLGIVAFLLVGFLKIIYIKHYSIHI